jgi:predicted phosphodiesterase
MKILVLADEEAKVYWDFFKKEDFADIDLIISCGDLKASYLSFLATMVPVPVLYVRGNHDDDYKKDPPGGCTCI